MNEALDRLAVIKEGIANKKKEAELKKQAEEEQKLKIETDHEQGLKDNETFEAQTEAGQEDALRTELKGMEGNFAAAEKEAQDAEAASLEAKQIVNDPVLDDVTREEIEGIIKEAKDKRQEFARLQEKMKDLASQVVERNAPKGEKAAGSEEVLSQEAGALDEKPEIAMEVQAETPVAEMVKEKPEPTPEESEKALDELSAYPFDSMLMREDYIVECSVSVESIIKKQEERTIKVKELQKNLQAFDGKIPSSLSDSEKNKLNSLLPEAYGEVYYSVWAPGNNRRYENDSIWPSTLDNINNQVAYYKDKLQVNIDGVHAKVAIVKGEKTPNQVGYTDIVKMKNKADTLLPTDKQKLLEKLQDQIGIAEKQLQKADDIIKKHQEESKKSGSALRVSEQTEHNALFDLAQTERKIRKQFAALK